MTAAYADVRGRPWAPTRHHAGAPGMAARAARLARAPKASVAAQKNVLHTIATYADPDGGNAYPSMATLAFDAGLDERTVRRAVRALEQQGALLVELGGRRYTPSRYQVVLPRLRAAPDPVDGPERVGSATGQGGNVPPSRGGMCPPTLTLT